MLACGNATTQALAMPRYACWQCHGMRAGNATAYENHAAAYLQPCRGIKVLALMGSAVSSLEIRAAEKCGALTGYQGIGAMQGNWWRRSGATARWPQLWRCQRVSSLCTAVFVGRAGFAPTPASARPSAPCPCKPATSPPDNWRL